MSLLIMLQVVSTEENFENKKNFTILIISISYYQLEWVQFEKNTMSGVSKFCPKIISYFCLVNEQKSDSNIQIFFSQLSVLTISNRILTFIFAFGE